MFSDLRHTCYVVTAAAIIPGTPTRSKYGTLGQSGENLQPTVARHAQSYASEPAMRGAACRPVCSSRSYVPTRYDIYTLGGKRGVAKQALTSNAPYRRWRAEGERPRPGKKNRGCPTSHAPHQHGREMAPISYYKASVLVRQPLSACDVCEVCPLCKHPSNHDVNSLV